MLQLTSRRFLRELDEAPEGNNLQYILKCPCILFFGNQGLYNEIMLGGNGGPLRGHVWGVPLYLLKHKKNTEIPSQLRKYHLLSHLTYQRKSWKDLRVSNRNMLSGEIKHSPYLMLKPQQMPRLSSRSRMHFLPYQTRKFLKSMTLHSPDRITRD